MRSTQAWYRRLTAPRSSRYRGSSTACSCTVYRERARSQKWQIGKSKVSQVAGWKSQVSEVADWKDPGLRIDNLALANNRQQCLPPQSDDRYAKLTANKIALQKEIASNLVRAPGHLFDEGIIGSIVAHINHGGIEALQHLHHRHPLTVHSF